MVEIKKEEMFISDWYIGDEEEPYGSDMRTIGRVSAETLDKASY